MLERKCYHLFFFGLFVRLFLNEFRDRPFVICLLRRGVTLCVDFHPPRAIMRHFIQCLSVGVSDRILN